MPIAAGPPVRCWVRQAIGQRNMVESEAENRENKKKALAAVLAEKRAELERADRYYQSLQQIEAEQNTLIAKLSSSES